MMYRWLCVSLLVALPRLHGDTELKTLVEGLQNPNFWTSVHAAEYLLDLDLGHDDLAVFLMRCRRREVVPMERVGLWRVMALRAQGTPEYGSICDRIREIAFAEPPPADQIHAVETLLKLQYKCRLNEEAHLRRILRGPDSAIGLRIYSAALLALVSPDGLTSLEMLLEHYRQDLLWGGVLLYALRLVHPSERLFAQVQSICRTAASESHRMAAELLLLNHRRMTFDQMPYPPKTPSKDALTILLLHAPQSLAFRQMLDLMRQSDDAELRLFAEYAALKTKRR